MSLWLETENLCRYYKRGEHTVKALDDVSIKINHGEFLAVVGSSGSGKSTLLNLIAGLDSPTSGDILVENKSLVHMTRKELSNYRASQIGIVFQSFNLINHFTALRNVEMALYFDHTPKKERKDKAVATLESLGLGDRLDHKPADLSGGEQQRVAMARALVKQPKILFADEPTGNLDYENSNQIGQLLRDLNKNGLTVVMVTHDLTLAQAEATRIIKMNYGKIVENSTGGGEHL